MGMSEKLRNDRLVFYEDDISRIGEVLVEFLSLSGARSAFLIDKEGHLVTREGASASVDTDALSALVAGSFAATRAMAHLLGEDEFSVMFHQGQRDNIQLTLIGDRTILTVIFDDSTQLGMIRLYTGETARKIGEILDQTKDRGEPELNLDGDFAASGRSSLDGIFG